MKTRRQAKQKKWAIIADDLTGACDTGAIFAKNGFKTVVLMNRHYLTGTAADVIVLTTNSRNLSARLARANVRRACRFLNARCIRLLYKKIDSTWKGQAPAEIESLMRAAKFSRAIVCPAFPAQGRTVQRGLLRVHGQPIADLIGSFAVLRSPFSLASIHRPISTAKIAAALRNGRNCLIADAKTDSDLACLVEAASQFSPRPLWVGSAGMARHLANALSRSEHGTLRGEATNARRHQPLPKTGLPLPLIVSGSNNPVTQRQISELVRAKAAQVCSLTQRSLTEIKTRLDSHRILILRPAVHQMAGELLLHKLDALNDALQSGRISSLVVIGGDTALLVVRWLGAKAIELRGEVEPGIPWGNLIGGKADGMLLITKAGGFGDFNSLVRAVNFLAYQSRSAS